MPTYILKNPFDPNEEIEFVAEDGVSQERAQAELRNALTREYAEDMVKATGTGTTKGVFSAIKFPIQSVMGTAMMAADAGKEVWDMGKAALGYEPSPGRGGDFIARGHMHVDNALRDAEKFFTKGWRPKTKPGRYMEALGAGAGSAAVPMGQATKAKEAIASVMRTATPNVMGAGMSQYIHENPQLFGESSDAAGAGAAILPGLLSMGRRQVIPRAPERANELIKETMSDTSKDEIKSAKELMARALQRKKDGSGVEILPGQAFGPDHPLVSLQLKTAAQRPSFQRRIHQQQDDASRVRKNAISDTLADGSPNPARIASLYREGGKEPLAPEDIQFIISKLDNLPITKNLSGSSPAIKIIEDAKNQITKDRTQATVVPGTPGGQALTTTKGGFKVMQPTPGTPPRVETEDLPIDSLGKLKSVKDDIASGPQHGMEGVTRGEIRQLLAEQLHNRSPKIKEADDLFRAMSQNLDQAKIGVPSPNAPAPVNTFQSGTHRETWGALLRGAQGNVPKHLEKVLNDPTGKELERALAYSLWQKQLAQGLASMSNAEAQTDVGLVPIQP